jgi:RNA polymerase sigma-70 factor, ECF subfamily
MERPLVEHARAGDRDAFEALVRLKVDAVYRTAYAILGNVADAQDATQETFISAWRSFRSLRDPDSFDAWLGRILTNACRMTLRRRRVRVREIHTSATDGEGSAGPVAPAPDDPIADTDAFDRAFERLPVEQRALLVAHHLDCRSVEELARDLGIPAGTVKSRLHAARSALGAALEGER